MKIIFPEQENGLILLKENEREYSSKKKKIEELFEEFEKFSLIKMPKFEYLEINNYLSVLLKDGQKRGKEKFDTEFILGYLKETEEYFVKLRIQDNSKSKKIKNSLSKNLIEEGYSTKSFEEAYQNFAKRLNNLI